MNFVQPIKSKEKIEKMKSELKKTGTRNYLLFLAGINVGLRISDLLKLRVRDFLNPDRTIKSHVEIKEEKTGKYKRFKINYIVAKELYDYIKDMEMEEYIFKSRNGNNKPITRIQAYEIIRNAGEKVGITNIGTHTLRKTFGYWHYKTYHDIAILMKIFNHSSLSITLRYIGVEQEEIDASYDSFSL